MPDVYRSPHSGTIADLIGRRGTAGALALKEAGDAAARQALVSGQAWGNAIQNIGQGVSGTLADFANYKAQAPQRAAQQAQMAEAEDAQFRTQAGRFAEQIKASGYNPAVAEPFFRELAKRHPEHEQSLQRALMEPHALKAVTDTLITQSPAYKAPNLIQRDPTKDLVNEGTGEVLQKGVAPPPEPKKPIVVGGRVLDPETYQTLYEPPAEPEKPTNPTEASLAFMAAQGNQQAAAALQKLRSLRAPQGSQTPRSPIWVVGADGQFQDLAGVAPPGSKPANTREQGRPVVSGDANRIADLDTSLNDLDVLTNTVTGSTGTSAKIGTMLPNWVTELTGRGSSAKQKQASIDRVKQVIGKALEGGVLRKEDESKYEKILPTIYDPPDVVTSKLKGLQEALTLRRQTTLDALADAGYDVSRFNERQRTPVTKSGRPVTVQTPDGQSFTFPDQKSADAFKKAAGIP